MEKALEAEMQAARNRVDKEIEEMNKNEITYVTFFVLIHAALFQFAISSENFLRGSAVFLLLIPMYGFFRNQSHSVVIRIHERYIKLYLEPRIYGIYKDAPPGLVNYYDKQKLRFVKLSRINFYQFIYNNRIIYRILFRKKRSGQLRRARTWLWGLMMIISAFFLFVSVFYPCEIIQVYRDAASNRK